MIYELLFAFVFIQTDKYTLNSGRGQCSGAEGCVQCWEVSSLTPYHLQSCGTCVKRVGAQVGHFQPLYLWPGNTNLTQDGMSCTGVHTSLSLSYLPDWHGILNMCS